MKIETLIQRSLNQVLFTLTRDTEQEVRHHHLNPSDLTYSSNSEYRLNCLSHLQMQLEKSPTMVFLSLEQLGEIVRDQIIMYDQAQTINDQMIETISIDKQFLNILLKDHGPLDFIPVATISTPIKILPNIT